MIKCLVSIYLLALSWFPPQSDDFTLLSEGRERAQIELVSSEDTAIKLAAGDFVSDVEKIAGSETAPSLSSRVIIGKVEDIDFKGNKDFQGLRHLQSQLVGKWESYRVFSRGGNLYIIGSDTRGTLWGIYHFVEEYLGIDPMYIWTDKDPKVKEELVFDRVSLSVDEPSFKFRGWFINDEDYLTEWKQFYARRNIDYKFYYKVIHPDVSDMIIETALRLRMNLMIPSSFNNVFNPAEEYALNEASKRGLIVSQHHQEPVGAGAFNFYDYYERQGKEAPFYSYLKNPEEVKMVWEEYIKEWAKYEDVIWQLGLRGEGDRPMWEHDPSIPNDGDSRGKIISDAIRYQYDMIRKYDPDGYMTLTTWMEISDLMEQGHIDIPDDINIVFADNSPGWGYTSDFYNVERQSNKQYGIYYHHQLWGSGPHFIQGISPQKTYSVIKEAVDYNSDDYCILNVGNVREFVQGLKLSAEFLYDFDEYSVEDASNKWYEYYYGDWAYEAQQVYQDFFDIYLLDAENEFITSSSVDNSPYLLDGHLAGVIEAHLTFLNHSYGLPKYKGHKWITAAESNDPDDVERYENRFPDLESHIEKQKANLLPVIENAKRLNNKMTGHSAYFFKVNMRIPAEMFYHFMDATIEVINAYNDEVEGNREHSLSHLQNALVSMKRVNEIKQAMLHGKWEHWYRGEYKLRFGSYEKFLTYLIESYHLDGKFEY